jgi:hypothetical protein
MVNAIASNEEKSAHFGLNNIRGFKFISSTLISFASFL